MHARAALVALVLLAIMSSALAVRGRTDDAHRRDPAGVERLVRAGRAAGTVDIRR